MIIEISVAIIALAFVILVVFLIITIRETNATLIEIRSKMESLNPVFNAFSNVGDFLEEKSKSYKLKAKIAALKNEANEAEYEDDIEEGSKSKDIAADVLDLCGVGFRLWQNLNKRR